MSEFSKSSNDEATLLEISNDCSKSDKEQGDRKLSDTKPIVDSESEKVVEPSDHKTEGTVKDGLDDPPIKILPSLSRKRRNAICPRSKEALIANEVGMNYCMENIGLSGVSSSTTSRPNENVIDVAPTNTTTTSSSNNHGDDDDNDQVESPQKKTKRV